MIQYIGKKHVKRGDHVWLDLEDGRYKCVLCGGVTSKPTENDLAERYERLTDAERDLCPQRD